MWDIGAFEDEREVESFMRPWETLWAWYFVNVDEIWCIGIFPTYADSITVTYFQLIFTSSRPFELMEIPGIPEG